MWYNGGPYQYNEKQMKTHIRRLRPALWWRKGVDVVVTHAPPRGIHDGDDLCHQGFACFRWLIDKYRPRLFLHGHIHAFFQDDTERTTLIDTTRSPTPMAIMSLKSKLQQIFAKMRGQPPDGRAAEVKSFKHDQEKEAAYDSRIRGVRTVPLTRSSAAWGAIRILTTVSG